ncbi:MAG: ABC transporter permease [Phycisphaerae bacterium]
MFTIRIMFMALRGLHTNLFRSMLATLGVIIGVGAVVSAISVLEGARRDVLDRFESLGADQLIVINSTGRRHGRQVAISSLLPADADAIERDSDGLVIATAPQSQGSGQIKYYEKNVDAPILGTTPAYATINTYHPAAGRFITKEDIVGRSMVCVLGHRVARDLFGPRPAVGKSLKIAGRGFTVVGVMEERGMLGFIEVDKQVIVPLSTAMGRLFGQRHLSSLAVQCVAADRLPECRETVMRTLRSAHHVRAGNPNDFEIFSQEQIKTQFAEISIIFAVVLYSIAGISMVVGGIGIMNIMMVSVTERTREIGVRIAVGARRFDILRQFLTEASIISLLGGGLGVLCGWAIANLLGEVTVVLDAYTPPSAVIVALVMAVAVGLVSGVYPAVKAARLDPVQALRFE